MKALLALCTASALLFMGCGPGVGMVTEGPEWSSMNGPRAQDVSALHLNADSTSAILAGTEDGNVYVCARPGEPWANLSTIQQRAKVHQFVQNPESPGNLYAATESGLFASTNNGTTWTARSVGAETTMTVGVRALAIDPWNTSMMYTGTIHKGMRRSTDGGMTWTPANDGIPGMDSADVHEILIDPSKPDRILAVASGLGVVHSSDAGNLWSRLTSEFTSTGSSVTTLVLNRQSPSTMVYGTNAGGIRKSTDGGTTWSPTRLGSAEGNVLSLSTIPGQPDALLAGTEGGLLISTDFGTSWRNISGTLPRIPLAAMVSPDGKTFFAYGEGIGLQQSNDSGATWTDISSGLGGATVRLVTTDEKSERVYVALRHTVLTYDPATGLWRSASSGLSGGAITSLVVDRDSPLHLFAATSLGGFQSKDGGQTWQPATRNTRVTPTILEPHPRIRTRMLASGTQGLDVSTDKGTTWQQVKPFGAKFQISSFTFSPTNTGVIYAAASQAALISRDGGLVWESSRYGLQGEEISAVTLDDRNPSVVYAWTSSGDGYRSLDAGLEWNRYSPPWKQNDTVLVAYDRYEPSSVVALVNGQNIYYSSTGGGAWFPLPSAKLDARAQSLWWNAPEALLYVGTRAKGVYRISLGKSLKELP